MSWLPQYHDMGLVGGYLVPLTIPPEPGAKPAEVTSRVSVTRRFHQGPNRLGARHVKVRRDDDAGAGLCVQALRGTVRVRTVRVVVAQAGRAEPE